MALTDLRTVLNDCETTTGWVGDDSVTAVTDTGLFYQGSTALSTQLSNADEHMYTTEDSSGGTDNGNITAFDITATNGSALFMTIKDNLVETQVNGGTKLVIGDGTNRIGYEVGGYDNVGSALAKNFNTYSLDGGNINGTTKAHNDAAVGAHTFAGTLANLSLTAITQIGYGSLHLSKAQGAIDNVFMDNFKYYVIDGTVSQDKGFAARVDAGTSGSPETFSGIASSDVTNGIGLIGNPIGNQYVVAGPLVFFANTADAFFHDSDSQVYFNTAGWRDNFFWIYVSQNDNAGWEMSFKLDNCIWVCTDAPGELGFQSWQGIALGDPQPDTVEITNSQFVNFGNVIFSTQQLSNFINNVTFTDCGDPTLTNTYTVYLGQYLCNVLTFTNSLLDVDMTTTTVGQEKTIFTFNSGGLGHAIYADTSAAGNTYTWDQWTFSGYAPNLSMSAATQANPVVVTTTTDHNLTDGTKISISGVVGMTELNGNTYYADNLTATTFALYSDSTLSTSVNGTGFTAYSSAGTVTIEPGTNSQASSGSTNAVFYNNSGGAVTINIVDGDTPTVRNGASSTTTINNNVTITLTSMKDNTEVRVYDTTTLDNVAPYTSPTELAGIENATAGTTDARTFAFSVASGTDITIRTFNTNWIADDTQFVANATQSLPVAQRQDRVFSNPV